MRKANVAAVIIGGVSFCILGGAVFMVATSSTVSPVVPKNDVTNIYEIENERLANVAAVTSISTTVNTTTSTTTYSFDTTAADMLDDDDFGTYDYYPEWAETLYENFYDDAVDVQTADEEPEVEEPTEAEFIPYDEAVENYLNSVDTSTYTLTENDSDNTSAEAEVGTNVSPSPNYTLTPAVVPAAAEETAGVSGALPITDAEYIILCNAVAHEAGCNWIGLYDKAKVVEVIMNRVYSPLYPNTISEVLAQYNQFTGSELYVSLGYFTSDVSEDVKAAVNLYFSEPGSFNHGYYGFFGDGINNYFY